MASLKVKPVAEALRKYRGNMAAVGRKFGVTRSAVWRFVDSHPDLKATLEECRESMKDTAESALYKAIKRGAGWAVRFYLVTQARDRGYGDKPDDPADKATNGVPVELVTRLFALLGSRPDQPQNGKPVAAESGTAGARLPE